MARTDSPSIANLRVSRVALAVAAACLLSQSAVGQETPTQPQAAVAAIAADDAVFKERISPLLNEFCVRCHNADKMKSGVRVDHLTAALDEKQIKLWQGIQKQVADEAMPPDDEPQPTPEQRKLLDEWITRSIAAARSRPTPRNGS